jgi:hypothetical protein
MSNKIERILKKENLVSDLLSAYAAHTNILTAEELSEAVTEFTNKVL